MKLYLYAKVQLFHYKIQVVGTALSALERTAIKAIAELSHRVEQHITVNLVNIMCTCFKMD